MFLTDEELAHFTERTQRPAQRRELLRMGYAFEVGASGRPKVLRSAVAERLSSGIGQKHRGPDLNALDAVG